MGTRGRLIAIEGGEGVGKSTQAALLASAIGAEASREPGGSPIAERIRDLLLDRSLGVLAPRAELYLMLAAACSDLSSLIEPALAAGRHVVVDRFAGSTLAYQGYGRRTARRGGAPPRAISRPAVDGPTFPFSWTCTAMSPSVAGRRNRRNCPA